MAKPGKLVFGELAGPDTDTFDGLGPIGDPSFQIVQDLPVAESLPGLSAQGIWQVTQALDFVEPAGLEHTVDPLFDPAIESIAGQSQNNRGNAAADGCAFG